MNTEILSQRAQSSVGAGGSGGGEGSNLIRKDTNFTNRHEGRGVERRAFEGIEIRDPSDGDAGLGTLVGYPIVFNSDSEVLSERGKTFIERVAPDAFEESLRTDPNVAALWDHNPGQPLARAPDTLKLGKDDRGHPAEIKVPDTTTGRDLVSLVRAKVVNGMSFTFRTLEDAWERRGLIDVRTILKAQLIEISPVTFPAYPDTSIALRSLEEYRKRAGEPSAGDAAGTPPTEGRESASDALVNDENLEPEWRLREIQFGIRKTLPNKGHDT